MKDFELHYSDKSVGPWGGMALMRNVLDKTGIKGKMQELELPSV
jgi:hypothetical protein